MSHGSFGLNVALVSSALLFGFYLAASSDAPSSSELEARPNHVLPAFSEDALSRISITRGTQKLVLRRAAEDDPDAFYLGTDGAQLADPQATHTLIENLAFAVFVRRFEADEQPSHDVLGAPQLRVQVQAGARSFELRLLSRTPASLAQPHAEFFAQVEFSGAPAVYGVVDEKLFEALSVSAQELRGNQLFPFSIQETSELVLEAPSKQEPLTQALSLRADELGFFVQSEEQSFRADRQRCDLIFFHLARAHLSRFVEQKEAEQLLGPLSTRTVITQKGPGKNVVVELGGECPGNPRELLALRRGSDPIAGCVSRSISPAFTWDIELVRDRSCSVLTADEIDHIHLRSSTKSVNIMRKDAGFVALHREREAISSEAGEEFFKVFATGELQSSAAPNPLPEQVWQLSISGVAPEKALPAEPWLEPKPTTAREHATRNELEVYVQDASSVWVHRLDDDTWWRVPERYMWAFSLDDGWSRARQLPGFDIEQVQWLSLEGTAFSDMLSDGGKQRATLRDERFYLSAPGAKPPLTPADSTLLRRLLEELAHLEALRFVPEQKRPSTAYMHFALQTTGVEQPIELWIGSRAAGGYLAWSTLSDGTFVLPYQTVQRLGFGLADRSAAQISPESLEFIELKLDARSYRFEAVEGQLHAAGELAEEQHVNPLVEALRALEVVARSSGRTPSEKALLSIRFKNQDEAQASTLTIYGPTIFRSLSVYRATVESDSSAKRSDAPAPRAEPDTKGVYLLSASGVQELLQLL